MEIQQKTQRLYFTKMWQLAQVNVTYFAAIFRHIIIYWGAARFRENQICETRYRERLYPLPRTATPRDKLDETVQKLRKTKPFKV